MSFAEVLRIDVFFAEEQVVAADEFASTRKHHMRCGGPIETVATHALAVVVELGEYGRFFAIAGGWQEYGTGSLHICPIGCRVAICLVPLLCTWREFASARECPVVWYKHQTVNSVYLSKAVFVGCICSCVQDVVPFVRG